MYIYDISSLRVKCLYFHLPAQHRETILLRPMDQALIESVRSIVINFL